MATALRLTINATVGRQFVPYLRKHLRRAHAILSTSSLRELSVALVDDGQMSELHDRFLGIPDPTDVLTFGSDDQVDGVSTGGDVVVCVGQAVRGAREHGTAVRDELLLYALHGMLHLCGFDDRTDRGFATMHRTEDMILTRLGVGPVFRPRVAAVAAANVKRKSSRKRQRKPRGSP